MCCGFVGPIVATLSYYITTLRQSHGPGIAVSLKVIRDTAQKPVPINFGVLCAVAVHLVKSPMTVFSE